MRDLPEILYDPPEIAWPWLVEHCPQIFDGIDVQKEPYAQYLKGKPMSTVVDMADVLTVARYFLKDLKLADISEALTGKREYGGAIYTRVKAVKQLLENTTTTQNEGHKVILEDIAA